MTDPAQIAASLSEGQRAALFGKFSWPGPMEQEEGERELYRLGLWGPHGGNSDLAKAVRHHLESKS